MLAVAAGSWAASGDPTEAARYGLRLAVLVGATPVLALTTAPQDLARALAVLPLPPGVVVALVLVWRFFDLFRRELRGIREATLLRGGTATLRQRWRAFFVAPAFVVAEHADRVTLMLELRGFDPAAPRTVFQAPRLQAPDAAALCLTLAVLTVGSLLERWA